MLSYISRFSETDSQIQWSGKQVCDVNAFTAFIQHRVKHRLLDIQNRTDFEVDMQALVTTDMASETLRRLMSSEPECQEWEVGESLAQCLLEEEYGIDWPWNPERDKRTPRASLPGADLVGFGRFNNEVWLVFGEVKTSNDQKNPPGVMNGRSGMIHQLDALASDPKLHTSLLKWLRVRCKDTPYWPLFEEATRRYLESDGRAMQLYGLLMRDTQPHDLDLRNRAKKLVRTVTAPTRVELTAWYLPHPISEWVTLTLG